MENYVVVCSIKLLQILKMSEIRQAPAVSPSGQRDECVEAWEKCKKERENYIRIRKIREIVMKNRWELIRDEMNLNTKRKVLNYYKSIGIYRPDMESRTKERLLRYYVNYYTRPECKNYTE